MSGIFPPIYDVPPPLKMWTVYESSQFVDYWYTYPVKWIINWGAHDCPWQASWHNLYIVHDWKTVFYVGESLADDRAWGRIHNHWHSNSPLGQFLRANKDRLSMFGATLFNSEAIWFEEQVNAEKHLIEVLSPALNVRFNKSPLPISKEYRLPIGCGHYE